MQNKKILVFASGGKDGGGSGFQVLVESTKTGILDGEIVGVVSNHENGGVSKRAEKFGINFCHFPLPREAEDYIKIAEHFNADLIACSGWLKLVKGLKQGSVMCPSKIINIHPGPLYHGDPIAFFGGKGMHGHAVHEAVLKSYKEGKIRFTELTIHFVTEKYDDGPIIFRFPVAINEFDTADDIASRVLENEHGWQPFITNLVLLGLISWDGKNPESLNVPQWYKFHLPNNLPNKIHA